MNFISWPKFCDTRRDCDSAVGFFPTRPSGTMASLRGNPKSRRPALQMIMLILFHLLLLSVSAQGVDESSGESEKNHRGNLLRTGTGSNLHETAMPRETQKLLHPIEREELPLVSFQGSGEYDTFRNETDEERKPTDHEDEFETWAESLSRRWLEPYGFHRNLQHGDGNVDDSDSTEDSGLDRFDAGFERRIRALPELPNNSKDGDRPPVNTAPVLPSNNVFYRDQTRRPPHGGEAFLPEETNTGTTPVNNAPVIYPSTTNVFYRGVGSSSTNAFRNSINSQVDDNNNNPPGTGNNNNNNNNNGTPRPTSPPVTNNNSNAGSGSSNLVTDYLNNFNSNNVGRLPNFQSSNGSNSIPNNSFRRRPRPINANDTPFPQTLYIANPVFIPDPTPAPSLPPVPTVTPTLPPTLVPTTTVVPSRQPSPTPTEQPSPSPTKFPTKRPTKSPTKRPTKRPTRNPTRQPTPRPNMRMTRAPTQRPTRRPSNMMTRRPTRPPTKQPTQTPSASPSSAPSASPSVSPSSSPSTSPTLSPSGAPTETFAPTVTSRPTVTASPTVSPTYAPTYSPTVTFAPTTTFQPTISNQPTRTYDPTYIPTESIAPTQS